MYDGFLFCIKVIQWIAENSLFIDADTLIQIFKATKKSICGTVVFAVLKWIFEYVAERMSVTTNCKCVMISTAFVMYFACQCFMGIQSSD